MITLILDTSKDDLNIGVLKDGELLINHHQVAKQIQSEITLPMLDKIFKDIHITPLEIDRFVLTIGPGSYTGLRIALTIVKVLAGLGNKEVYTINTLLAYIGKKEGKNLAMMDARSKRAYVTLLENDKVLIEPCVMSLSEVSQLATDELHYYGDAHLIGKDSLPIDLVVNIVELEDTWHKVERIDELTPLYLKENSDYGC